MYTGPFPSTDSPANLYSSFYFYIELGRKDRGKKHTLPTSC